MEIIVWNELGYFLSELSSEAIAALAIPSSSAPSSNKTAESWTSSNRVRKIAANILYTRPSWSSSDFSAYSERLFSKAAWFSY